MPFNAKSPNVCCTLENSGDPSTFGENIDLYINGYFDTTDKSLTDDKFCTNISGNCNDIVKSYDGTVWNFFSEMSVNFQTTDTKCIKMTKNYTLVSTVCTEKIHGMVCRLDCCKINI